MREIDPKRDSACEGIPGAGAVRPADVSRPKYASADDDRTCVIVKRLR